MKESNRESDRHEIATLLRRIEELEAEHAQLKSRVYGRRFFRVRKWAWLPITLAVLLALGVLGAQSKQDALYIAPTGNVGINQTNPEKTLDVNGDAVIRGQLQARGVTPVSPPLPAGSGLVVGDSDIYFTGTTHAHTGLANQQGFAAIENDGKDYNALMILGRSRSTPCCNRVVSVIDKLGIQTSDPQATLDVNGNTIVRSDLTVRGNSSISGNSSVSANLTIGGRADLGIYQRQSTSCSNGTCDIACEGKDDVAISGGGWVGRPSMLRESRPLSQNTWRVACAVAGLGVPDSKCDQAWVVCARHAK